MGKGGAADEELFSMLKDLRKKVAKQHGLPPFVIFQDPSLEDMAVQYPITFEEMQNITGVGVGKARKFGEEFIRLIKAYVDEKEIIRPQDMIVKGVASKSGNKIFIIQSIDRKMDFEDIARAKDLDFDELLTEIEGIVNAGTKLDISYYLKEFMDEDKIEDIYLYFRRTPRATRSTRPSRSWGRTIPRRRYAWCALSLCASRATDFRFYRVFSALRLRPGTVLFLCLAPNRSLKPFLRNQKADETGLAFGCRWQGCN